MRGFFGKLFDFNKDGKLDVFERTADFAAFEKVGGSLEADDKAEKLEDAGLDEIDLEFMDEEERREALEGAGLDPDDFDFD